jgi:hypothetical protein
MWAEEDELEPIVNNYNVVDPPPEKQLAGWSYKEFPPRNWLNWLARWTYRNLAYLIQQEKLEVMAGATGVGLFPLPPAGFSLCILYAVDIAVPANYVFAIGSNNGGTINFAYKQNNVLDIPSNPIVGPDVPISGGSGPNNVLVCGQTKAVATP